jgi:hypothetical protein
MDCALAIACSSLLLLALLLLALLLLALLLLALLLLTGSKICARRKRVFIHSCPAVDFKNSSISCSVMLKRLLMLPSWIFCRVKLSLIV